jgi:hypothetical protein
MIVLDSLSSISLDVNLNAFAALFFQKLEGLSLHVFFR